MVSDAYILAPMMEDEELTARALHALAVLKEFPEGSLTRQEVDALAQSALAAMGVPIPDWRVSV